MKSRLAVISSFNPSATLLSTVAKLQEYYSEFDIVIVDSESSDCSIYHSLPPECNVDYVKNKNYELGGHMPFKPIQITTSICSSKIP